MNQFLKVQEYKSLLNTEKRQNGLTELMRRLGDEI